MSIEPKQHNMAVTRVFDAPIEQVWNAWSDAEQVRRWWGPTGFTCPLARMDFREGGTSLVCMRAPAEYGGQDLYNTWTYTRIVPNERIEFVQHFADQDGNKVSPTAHGLPPKTIEQIERAKQAAALLEQGVSILDAVYEMGYADQPHRTRSLKRFFGYTPAQIAHVNEPV